MYLSDLKLSIIFLVLIALDYFLSFKWQIQRLKSGKKYSVFPLIISLIIFSIYIVLLDFKLEVCKAGYYGSFPINEEIIKLNFSNFWRVFVFDILGIVYLCFNISCLKKYLRKAN